MIYDRYKNLHLEGNKVFPIKRYYKTMNMSLRACCQTCWIVIQSDNARGETSYNLYLIEN